MIGDRETDIILRAKARCQTIFVKNGNNQSPQEITPSFFAKDLLDAAKYISKISYIEIISKV